jgi:hypothetical protein
MADIDGESLEADGEGEEAEEEKPLEQDQVVEEEDEVPEVVATKRPAAASVDEWNYHFSKELMLPWRAKGKATTKDPGLPIDTSNLKDADFVVGEWPDGSKHPIGTITVGEYKALLSQKPSSTGTLWECDATGTKHKLMIKQKIDRHLLLILVEQKREICCIRLDTFGEVPDQKQQLAKSDIVLARALKFLIEVGLVYSRGECDRGGLHKLRDDMLAKSNLKVPGRGAAAMKRPAAATAQVSEALRAAQTPAADSAMPQLSSATAKKNARVQASASSASSAGPFTCPPADDTLSLLHRFFAG